MRAYSTFLIVSVLLVFVGNGCSRNVPASTEDTNPKKYTLEIEGTSGLEVKLLMVTKPTEHSIEREESTVTVPFKKSFEAVKHGIWVDSEYQGKKGKISVALNHNGQTIGLLGNMQSETAGSKTSGYLGDL